MNGHNLMFRTDPIWYVNQRAINNVAWFQNNQVNLMNLTLSVAKQGSFDFVGGAQDPQVIFTPVGNVAHIDQPISAYWCPFVQGVGILPGFVDFPRYNPPHRFVFTAAMNGCAFVLTTSPLGANFLRVYHHQHPGNQGIDQLIQNQGGQLISIVAHGDYGTNAQPNAFNFLYYRNGGWRYVLQSQTLNLMTHDVALNPAAPPVMIDAT